MVEITPWQQMASSCAGALLVSLFMTPLDVVKIRLQAQDMAFERKCFLYNSSGTMDLVRARVSVTSGPIAFHSMEEICNCKWYDRPKYFNGTMDAFVKISRAEGLSSLWSGLSPTLMLAVPTTVIYFTSYDQLRKKLFNANILSSSPYQESLIPLAAGGMARIWAVTMVSPLELVRTKMQSQKMGFPQLRVALRNTVRSEGILGLWKGCAATLYRDVPFSAIYWPCYEGCKQMLLASGGDDNFGVTFVAGAFAGLISSTVTLPMDVVKTRRQLEVGSAVLGSSKPVPSSSTWSVVMGIVHAQGARGLFSGLIPRILKVAPACAIMISSYEYGKKFFRERNQTGLEDRNAQSFLNKVF